MDAKHSTPGSTATREFVKICDGSFVHVSQVVFDLVESEEFDGFELDVRPGDRCGDTLGCRFHSRPFSYREDAAQNDAYWEKTQ